MCGYFARSDAREVTWARRSGGRAFGGARWAVDGRAADVHDVVHGVRASVTSTEVEVRDERSSVRTGPAMPPKKPRPRVQRRTGGVLARWPSTARSDEWPAWFSFLVFWALAGACQKNGVGERAYCTIRNHKQNGGGVHGRLVV